MDILVVVDMQNDFIDGALGTKEAVAIVPKVVEKIKGFKGRILYTRDTHSENYLDTQEGSNLPVPHCIKGTKGWELHPEIEAEREEMPIDKRTFGSDALGPLLRAQDQDLKAKGETGIESIRRPVYGYLRNLQCHDCKGIPAGSAGHCGCCLLRRSYEREP